MNWNAKKALGGMAVARKMRDLADYDMDDALGLLGLRRRPSAPARFMGALGLVLGGVAVGAVLGMMMAPRASQGLRQGLQNITPGTSRGTGYGAQPVGVGTQGSSLS